VIIGLMEPQRELRNFLGEEQTIFMANITPKDSNNSPNSPPSNSMGNKMNNNNISLNKSNQDCIKRNVSKNVLVQ
jgi:hypothetical protein